MGVDNNHYNYQIAVIFAILIGGCLLLGATIAGIYYVCVNGMRDDKKTGGRSRRSSPSPWQQQQYRQGESLPQAPTPVAYQQAAAYAVPPPPPAHATPQPSYSQPPYTAQYEFNRSTMPSPLQPQPLLTPQQYEPYRPSPYDESRVVSMSAQPYTTSFHQSSV